MVIVFDSCLASGGLVPRVEMDIHEFLGANYGDLFDPPECNFDLQDSLNNDWLENIFSSSSSSLSPSSSSSISSSTPAPMTGIDDLLPGSTSPDSVHYEHSYSMGSCDSSPSLDSWHSSTDKGDPFEFLRDLCPPIFDLGCDMVEETPARVKEEDGLDLDPQWMESSSSSSPSSCGEVTETAAPSPPVERQTKKSIVLLTDEAGQTMTFTSEETNNSSSSSSHNNNNNEELILVDWNYEDQDEKDPIDLSMYRGKLIPFSNGKKDGPTVIHQAATGLTVTTFSSPWQKQEVRNASRSFTLTEALFSNPVPTEGQLLLTDEEKNTLVAEGYPVPTKLPLGKAEEKYLKKIRRKIKNKISAQESRRKKKEYMDHLELKMQKYCQENTELMKKVEHLEGNNRQLLVQLRNIQKILKVTGSVSTTGGTSLMVLVLFFAAFIGSWSPISWSIGYGRLATVSMMGSGGDQVSVAAVGGAGGVLGGAGGQPMPCAPFIGPDLQHPMVDVYSTLSRRSRLLMSTKDEEDAYNDSSSSSLLFGPTIPASYIQTLAYWFSSVTGGKMMEREDGEQKAAEEGEGVDDWGFTVKHILPLTQRYMIFKETPTALTSNETFRLPLSSKSQPNPPFPVADKTEQLQMER